MTDYNLVKILDFNEINACASDLKSLGPDTEPEFLKIGNALNTLATSCLSMTDDAVKMSQLANFKGDDPESANDSFVRDNSKIFEAVTDHVKGTLMSLSGGEHLLIELLSRVKRLREPIRKLHSIGKMFRILGVAIKVESSRNHEDMHGFNLLAGEVAGIAKLVQDHCRYCVDKADLVDKNITLSRQVLNKSDNAYDDSGEKAIYNILRSLEDIGHRSDQLAAGIHERSAAMVHGISDVVMAMQFHDITRQQLEHVASALIDVAEKSKSAQASDAAGINEQVVLEIYSILSIQAAHLNSIYEQIFAAKKTIQGGLGQTMEQARIQAEDARKLLGIEDRSGGSSIVASLEKEIDNIVVSLSKSLAVVQQAADVSREVYQNVSEIGVFVNKIEEIAFDVKILAINAMIEALKAKTAGNALTVLAKELSDLSQKTRDGATHSIEMLENILAGTRQQLEFSENLDQSSAAVDAMINQAKSFVEKILLSLQMVGIIGQKMDGAGRDLSTRITKLVPAIRFPQIMGDRIDKNWRVICRTIDRIEESHPHFLEKRDEIMEILEQLTQKYAMDRERSIHAQVAGGQAVETGTGNAELFEDDGFELF